MDPIKTAVSTPSTSPGLFSPTAVNPIRNKLPSLDGTPHSSPYLHPLQMHKVRETHKAQVEQDFITGRKLINQYEIINEIGRGVHGKVKLARSLETGEYVAIKIIQRFSKKRKLGRVTVSPEDKTKREIAILKKIRHPNVVGLLEVIDDPELKKIYMVLEHVELGEIVWRRKGPQALCLLERRRIENEQRGMVNPEDEKFFKMQARRRQQNDAKRAKMASSQGHQYWSLEHGNDDDEGSVLSTQFTNDSYGLRSHRSTLISNSGSRSNSRAPSRGPSGPNSRAHTPLPTEFDIGALDSDNEEDEETPGPLRSIGSNHGSGSALAGSYYGAYPDDCPPHRVRSPSVSDSIISHMSSVDGIPHDSFADDFSYVPCFTIDQARMAFRDTVLGLEYLHYEGIVHRDIKPANLLWTKDHRLKISDFGVSYFGRPIRDGETEENISEADATDFDDDLELSKTVGTPAFFAPELCYTDVDVEQPKVTEQIDVWSLGVTLYCLIFARIPFLAEDEWQLFRCIAKEDLYIPRMRLKAVDPNSTIAQTVITNAEPSNSIYRKENEADYEPIGDELYDLLRRMLIKDPAERMKLREVKRHPWVISGLGNVIGWLDDTDPSRRASGRRIQVDKNELDRAVVPITFLERARSAVKKTINKVISVTRSETRSDGSRRRAASSATSSGNDTNLPTPITPMALRDSRRASVRGDESYFAAMYDAPQHEHPLAQSLTASPAIPAREGDPFAMDFPNHSFSVGATPTRETTPAGATDNTRPPMPDRTISATASVNTVLFRGHSHSRSMNTPRPESLHDDGSTTPLFTDHMGALFGGYLWHGNRGREYMPDIKEQQVISRAQSVDRNLFESENKHGEAVVAVTTATAPGLFQSPMLHHPRPRAGSRSATVSPTNSHYDKPLPSPLFFNHKLIHSHQREQSASTPNVPTSALAASNLDDRPSTASRTPEGKTPPPRTYGTGTPESFQRALENNERRRRLEFETERRRQQQTAAHESMSPRCPPSPDDYMFARKQEEALRAQSYSSVNSTSMASQLTSEHPSNLTSPISSVNLGFNDVLFPSVPSLPALVSGASSVSADTEGDMLQYPGEVTNPFSSEYESTPETLTPPSLSKESTSEVVTPLATRTDGAIHLNTEDEDAGYIGDRDKVDEDSDSDSEDGLMMMKRKPRAKTPTGEGSNEGKDRRKEVRMPQRRDTNASITSTETARKVESDA